MKGDREKWDKKYKAMTHLPSERPNAFLREHIHILPPGRALDIAAGTGQNAVFLARNGFQVEAVDISPIALSRARSLATRMGVKIRTIRADLDRYIIQAGTYDLITNFYFLDRRLFPKIRKGLTKGGKIVFETYTVDHLSLRDERLSNDKYFLRPNELLHRFRDFRILSYREGIIREGGRRKAVASLIAEKPGVR